MHILFQSPWAAALLLLLPLLWWRSTQLPRWQRVLRAALLICVVLALVQPLLLLRGGPPAQVVILDQRASLDPQQRAALRHRLQQRLAATPAGTRTSVLQLAGARLPLEVDEYLLLGAHSPVQALHTALERLPAGHGGTLVYLGDGGSADRQWGTAVAALVERGIGVVVEEPTATPGAPRLVDVQLDPTASGALALARIRVAGRADRVQVVVLQRGTEVARSPTLALDGQADVTLRFAAGAAGFHPVRVVLQQAGSGRELAALAGTVAVQDPLSVLYVAADPAAGAPLQRLLGSGFRVQQQAPDAIDAGSVASADVAVIDGLGVQTLPATAQAALAEAVSQRGMGLLFSGGGSAFAGLPREASQGGPLARLLPVGGQPQEQLQDPSVALVVIIDSSGSMAGAPMELAKQVARLAVRRLKPEDRVGVVEFYGARQWSVPIQPARDPADVERAIGRMQAQGGTQLFPAIQEAYFGLKNTDARFKHMLVITDAGVEDDNYQRLLRHIAQDRINVSTVLVGEGEGEQRMAEMANWGRGRFYQIGTDASMVDINLKQPQLQPSPGYRSGRFEVQPAAGQAWWQRDALQGMPALKGLATAVPRAGAQIMARSGEQPVVASWQYGAGRVTTLMTEPLGAGTAGWGAWPGYGPWLARLLAGTARQQPAQTLQVSRNGQAVQVLVEQADAEASATLRLALVDADGGERDVPLQRRTPTVLEAGLQLPAGQDARLTLQAAHAVLRATDGVWTDVGAEPSPVRYRLPLQALATLTRQTRATPEAGWQLHDLRTLLAALAIALYLIELLCRRWPWRTPSFSWNSP
ncbi:VWA domain-containing protein [Xanthomonas campestris]|uniref:VWA domain-containing protein n=1 Tax=Xanthomonas campestris TaxID=339 RepID=UPI001E64982A|nr:VWA domain-containing protein [Xanthomonas campestris]MCC4603064.1 VWA domain-containing protein [Xanthomonas campestris pv. parthenii]